MLASGMQSAACYGNVASESQYPGHVISPASNTGTLIQNERRRPHLQNLSLKGGSVSPAMADQTVVEKMSELQVDAGKKVII